jgi:hypothetical protein
MKNKKAQLDVLIIVFLTLVLVGIALFLFSVSAKNVNDSVYGVLEFNDLYIEEERFIFELRSILQNVDVDDFEQSVNESYFSLVVVKGDLFMKYSAHFQGLLKDGKINIIEPDLEGGGYKILIEDFNFYIKENEFSINHVKDITLELDL